MKQDPPIDARCRDKFLVQSVAIDSSKEFANPGSIVRNSCFQLSMWDANRSQWQHIDESEKSTIQEKKIRVVFLGPSSSAAASTPSRNGLNGGSNRNVSLRVTSQSDGFLTLFKSSVATPEVAPPAYDNARSPSPEDTFTPATRNSVRTASVGPSIKSEPEVKEESSTVKESVVSAASAAVGAVAGVMKPTIEQLKAQLTEVEAKIAAYNREHGVTEGLRQRSSAIAKGETSSPVVNDMAVRVQRSEGVPVQIVAALCLLSFLLAYLFF